MARKKSWFSLFLCYLLWGFQPLYWSITDSIDSFTILGVRIIMAALFSLVLLSLQHRLHDLKAVFHDKQTLKFLLPAVLFLLLDWGVFIAAVNAGHVLDTSLGYYISPLLLFAVGALVYREHCSRVQLCAIAVAAVGVLVSAVAFGSVPYISLIIASNWAIYASIKKNVHLDGVVSIAAETLLLTPLAVIFLLCFRSAELASLTGGEIVFLLGSGIVTALPMYLYTDSIRAFPLILMSFSQYLSPTFNMCCGLLLGESFSQSQRSSLLFFLAAIGIFTAGEVRQLKKSASDI